eukprot:6214752-Pleurochrysis_carterae.AAC.4
MSNDDPFDSSLVFLKQAETKASVGSSSACDRNGDTQVVLSIELFGHLHITALGPLNAFLLFAHELLAIDERTGRHCLYLPGSLASRYPNPKA